MRNRNVFDREPAVFKPKERLRVQHEFVCVYPFEIKRDETKKQDIMLEPDAVPHVPKVCLVNAVADLPHVYGFQAAVVGLELRAECLVVSYIIAERERVAGTDDSHLSLRDGDGIIAVGPESLRIDADVLPFTVVVRGIKIRDIRPSQIGIVSRMKDVSGSEER